MHRVLLPIPRGDDFITVIPKQQAFQRASSFPDFFFARSTMDTPIYSHAPSSIDLVRKINHGLDLLCAHRLTESASTLRQALKMIANAVKRHGGSAIPADYASLYFESVSIQDKLPGIQTFSSVDHNTLHLHQGVFVFHHRREQTVSASASCRCPQEMDLHVRSLSAALLYNLAFVHQLRGLYDRTALPCCHQQFEKAGRLYDMAMASLQETTAQSTPYVMLAVLNNQAHLNTQIWNFFALETNIHAMKFLLSQLDEQILLLAHDNFDPTMLEAFYMNVICAQGIPTRSAPAA